MEEREIKLTEEEKEFCELFVDGGKGFAGQAAACYTEVFGENCKNVVLAARRLMDHEFIAAYIGELLECRKVETETIAVKLQVAETLKAVMTETASGEYTDKFGVTVSPAPLRAVSVNAAKALMEIFPIKHSASEGNKGKESGGNIIFNVIVPQNTPEHVSED